MVRKLNSMLLCLIAGMALTFFGCGNHDDAAENEINWKSENSGTLEIINTSNKDIVVFVGQTPTKDGLMGGIRAGSTKKFDISKKVDDFAVGGWTVLRGMTREEYNDNSNNLAAAKVEFNAMATYGAGKMYRITIDYAYLGEYAFRATNRGRVGLELRKDSPEGEKVAYLPALQNNQMIYTASTDAVVLFPFYVLYNRRDATVTTFKATAMTESVMATPRDAKTASNIQTYYFPNDETDSWEKIVGTLKSPVAYITVTNNVMNQGAYFTNSGSTRYYSQGGYDAIGSGEQLVFEVESTQDGTKKQLVVTLYGGTVMVPVRGYNQVAKKEEVEKQVERKDENGEVMRDENGEIIYDTVTVEDFVRDNEGAIIFENEIGPDGKPVLSTDAPDIQNGYDYVVSVTGSGSTAAGYTATLEKKAKRDLSDLLESM